MLTLKVSAEEKNNLLPFAVAAVLLIVVIAVLACNRKFDAPPAFIPPNIQANTAIAALKAAHTPGIADAITTDLIIEGIVIANDSSGNFYKQLILQDSTGGIAVRIDDYNLYTSFPIGRQVFVQMNGLYVNDDGGLLYIGTSPDVEGNLSGIPSRLKDKYLVKGELGLRVLPRSVTVQDLKADNDKYAYTLIQLDSFEVKSADTAKTYANAINKTDASIIVKNCSGDSMVVRSSGFSSFAGIHVPNGNGTLTAVYAYYKSPYSSRITPQVMIRDTSDLQMNGTRCSGPQTPVGNGQLISIQALRTLYPGSDIKLGAYKISGVVISDAASKNVSAGSVIIQDGNRGIAVYFGGTVTYQMGDSIVMDVTGDSLINYRGSLEVKTQYGAAKPLPVATGRTVVPNVTTIQDIKTNLAELEFTLVKIKDAFARGSNTFGGSQTLTDASGSMVLYTSFSALFAGDALPSDTFDWVGYGSFYNTTPQFQIRNVNDISIPLPPPPAGDSGLIISEYIEGSSTNKYLELFNAGSQNADLSQYHLSLFINGHTAADVRVRLDSATALHSLPPGGLLVLRSASALLTLPDGVTAFPSPVCNFNGNDALTLEKAGSIVDVFGKVGEDPGAGWTIANDSNAAVDKTVRRNPAIVIGNKDWTTSADGEWTVVAITDDVSDLGKR